MSQYLFPEVALRCGPALFDFLELKDFLSLSSASSMGSSLLIPAQTLNEKVNSATTTSTSATDNSSSSTAIFHKRLHFPHEITAGMLRRILHQLKAAEEDVIVVNIDDRKGRILLDIGSLRSDEDSDEEDEDHDGGHERMIIFKELEKCSYDEYDDFNPRHPLPKDRAHRRGDSYFNSDIDMVVGELGNQQLDLSNIAKAALNDEAAEGGAAGGDGIASKGSVKDRILARTKNNYPGRPKPSARAVKALNEEDGEEES